MAMLFQDIYQLHKNLVYNLSLQYTQNVEDAEEITQDVFVSVHSKLNDFKFQSDIKTWLYRITVNKSLDFLKAKKRKKRASIFYTWSVDDSDKKITIVEFNHPGVELEQKEAIENIFQCINTLPPKQKTVVLLLKIEGMSQAEVADIMRISDKAVESIFQRAKSKLKSLLKENEGK